MNKKIIVGVLLALALLAVAIGIGAQAYHLGVAQGLAISGKLDAPTPGVVPAPFAYRAWAMHRPGFGGLSCLLPLLFLFLFLGLMRAFCWRGHWGMHHHGPKWEGGAPPMFEEWHRKMHAAEGTAKQESK